MFVVHAGFKCSDMKYAAEHVKECYLKPRSCKLFHYQLPHLFLFLLPAATMPFSIMCCFDHVTVMDPDTVSVSSKHNAILLTFTSLSCMCVAAVGTVRELYHRRTFLTSL